MSKARPEAIWEPIGTPSPSELQPGRAADAGTAEAAIDRAPPGILRRLPSSGVAIAGLSIVLFWAILALAAPLLPLQPPNAQDFAALAAPYPSAQHWLGTDVLGRDVLSRLVWGARTVLFVAPIAVVTTPSSTGTGVEVTSNRSRSNATARNVPVTP